MKEPDDRYKKEQDLIFQELEEKELLQRQAANKEQAQQTRSLEILTKDIIEMRAKSGKPITDERARQIALAWMSET